MMSGDWWVPGVNIWMPEVSIFLVQQRVICHLASYPVDRLDIQGRGKGPLLGSMWEELLHFEEPYVVGALQGGPCAEEEEGLGLAWACSLP